MVLSTTSTFTRNSASATPVNGGPKAASAVPSSDLARETALGHSSSGSIAVDSTHFLSAKTALHVLAVVIFIFGAFLAGRTTLLIERSPVLASAVLEGTDTASLRVAQDYYDGVNHFLETGDAAKLLPQLDAQFATYSLSSKTPAPGSQLIAELDGLRSAYPGARYEIEDLTSRNGMVFASVRLTGGEGGSFVGIPLGSLPAQVSEEMLRIRAGVVVVRWIDTQPSPRFVTLAATDIVSAPHSKLVPELRQWNLDSTASGTIEQGTLVWLTVKSGSIQIVAKDNVSGAIFISGSDGTQHTLVQGNSTRAGVGDMFLLPGHGSYRYRTVGGQAAELLAVQVDLPGQRGGNTQPIESGVTRTLLARGFVLNPGQGTTRIAIGRMTLPTGYRWDHEPLENGGEFLEVADGSLTAMTGSGLIWTANRDATLSASQEAALLPAYGAAIDSRETITYRADGDRPTTAWIVTFQTTE